MVLEEVERKACTGGRGGEAGMKRTEWIVSVADEGEIGVIESANWMQELVRCEDCKNGHHIVNAVNGEVMVYRVFCKPTQAIHEPDWFCADGERR